MTPTTANFDARWANLAYAALPGTGKWTAVTSSSGSRADWNRPVKNESAGMRRRSVAMVAPSPTSAAG
jgi:hypothetical protein